MWWWRSGVHETPSGKTILHHFDVAACLNMDKAPAADIPAYKWCMCAAQGCIHICLNLTDGCFQACSLQASRFRADVFKLTGWIYVCVWGELLQSDMQCQCSSKKIFMFYTRVAASYFWQSLHLYLMFILFNLCWCSDVVFATSINRLSLWWFFCRVPQTVCFTYGKPPVKRNCRLLNLKWKTFVFQQFQVWLLLTQLSEAQQITFPSAQGRNHQQQGTKESVYMPI